MRSVTPTAQLVPAAWILGGMALGFIVYALLARLWRRGAAAGAVLVFWGGLGGLYMGLDRISLSARQADAVDRTIGAMFVFSLMWIAARIAGDWTATLGQRADHKFFSISLYSTLVQAAILIIGLMTVLSSLGIAIAPLLTTLGLGGLAVALALNDTLSNLFAGVQIVAAKQIRVGDYVKFDFAEGEVVDIYWHNTMIRDFQSNLVVIPNSKINTNVFTNYSMCVSSLLVPVNATIAWKRPFDDLRALAERAACDAVTDVAGKIAAEDCSVYLTAINETSVQVTALLPVAHMQNRARAVSGFLSRLHDASQTS
jgi:small-conductance mechanosensitive channel